MSIRLRSALLGGVAALALAAASGACAGDSATEPTTPPRAPASNAQADSSAATTIDPDPDYCVVDPVTADCRGGFLGPGGRSCICP